MSVVTGIMLILGVSDDDPGDALGEVQAWIARRYRDQQLKDVSFAAGGYKHPQFVAMSAGINGFVDEDEFAKFVMTRQWWAPENVVLVLQPETGETRVFRAGGYELTRLDELAVEG